MSITIESTTDSTEAVTQAMGGITDDAQSKVEDTKEKMSASEESEETNVAEASETSENEEVEEQEDSDDVDSEESDNESLEEEPKKIAKKPKNGFKRRIDKLNQRVSQKEQELEYWKSQALKKESQTTQEKSEEQLAAPLASKPLADDFETHEDYVEALVDWKAEEKLATRDAASKEQSLKTEYQQKLDSHLSRVNEFKESNEDFDELIEDIDDIPMSVTVQEVILSSDNGPELMYELAKDREEYERICMLPAIAAARALGKFEARIAASKSSSQKQETKTTKAPKPISPVGSKSVKATAKSPDEMSFQEYKRWRESSSTMR